MNDKEVRASWERFFSELDLKTNLEAFFRQRIEDSKYAGCFKEIPVKRHPPRSKLLPRNLPFDRIHHVSGGFGTLILPWFGRRWLILFDGSLKYISLPKGLRLKDSQFHNCSSSGVY